MIQAPLPIDEAKRLEALAAYAILDTDSEEAFDDLTAIAAAICGTPIALMSLIDAHRQWFKSHHGLAVRQTPRELAFCAHAILQNETFVVPDAMLDARFERNPLTTGAQNVRFYAGTPLIDSGGHALGTLCVIDHVPRELTAFQLESLGRLGRLAMCQMELRRERDTSHAKVRATTALLGNLGQDIRAPLSKYVGLADQLAGTQLTPVQAELVEQLQTGSGQLLNTLNNVIDYASLDNGQIRLAAQPFDLRRLVDSSMAEYAGAAAGKDIALQLAWSSTAKTLRVGDPGRVTQVLRNLLDNAIRYTERGRVTLSVSDGSGESELRLQVEDTGIGIAPERVHALFQTPALTPADAPHTHGTISLGLTIVGQLVRLMGGDCGAISHLGTGSRVWCSMALPPATHTLYADTSRAETSRAATAANAGDARDLSGYAVLVVAEDAVSLMLLLRLLQRHKCEVTVAGFGPESAEVCRVQEFDLVLVDEVLPGMSGYAVAAQIRALSGRWNKHMPIVALTADSSQMTHALCVEVGITDQIEKPLSRKQFDAALTRCIGPSVGDRPSAGDQDRMFNRGISRSA